MEAQPARLLRLKSTNRFPPVHVPVSASGQNHWRSQNGHMFGVELRRRLTSLSPPVGTTNLPRPGSNRTWTRSRLTNALRWGGHRLVQWPQGVRFGQDKCSRILRCYQGGAGKARCPGAPSGAGEALAAILRCQLAPVKVNDRPTPVGSHSWSNHGPLIHRRQREDEDPVVYCRRLAPEGARCRRQGRCSQERLKAAKRRGVAESPVASSAVVAVKEASEHQSSRSGGSIGANEGPLSGAGLDEALGPPVRLRGSTPSWRTVELRYWKSHGIVDT